MFEETRPLDGPTAEGPLAMSIAPLARLANLALRLEEKLPRPRPIALEEERSFTMPNWARKGRKAGR
jgi:hypothetical protein